jgi:hypothetical protein
MLEKQLALIYSIFIGAQTEIAFGLRRVMKICKVVLAECYSIIEALIYLIELLPSILAFLCQSFKTRFCNILFCIDLERIFL